MRHNFFWRASAQDAACQAPQSLSHPGILGTSAIIKDTDVGMAFDGVPEALGDLEVSEVGAIGPPLAGFAQVHVRHYTYRSSARYCNYSMYVVFFVMSAAFRHVTP